MPRNLTKKKMVCRLLEFVMCQQEKQLPIQQKQFHKTTLFPLVIC